MAWQDEKRWSLTRCNSIWWTTPLRCKEYDQPSSGTFLYRVAHTKRPRGLAVDDKFLYVADEATHEILVYHKHDGSFARKWGRKGQGKGQLKEPYALAVDEQHVYVTDANARISVFNKTTHAFLRCIGEGTLVPTNCRGAVDDQHVWVTDYRLERVCLFTKQGGRLVMEWGEDAADSDGGFCPSGIAVDTAVFVDRAVCVDSHAAHSAHLQHAQQTQPTECAHHVHQAEHVQRSQETQHAQHVWVADNKRHRIHLLDYNPHGDGGGTLGVVERARVLGSAGKAAEQFNCPYGLAVDEQHLFVADENNHRVQVLRKHDGAFVRGFGSQGDEDGEFEFPHFVAIDEKYVWVSELVGNRVQCVVK